MAYQPHQRSDQSDCFTCKVKAMNNNLENREDDARSETRRLLATVKRTQTIIGQQTAVSVAVVVVLLGAAFTSAYQAAKIATEVEYLRSDVKEFQNALDSFQTKQIEKVNHSENEIKLIFERMRADDTREQKDTAQLTRHESDIIDLKRRVTYLEQKVNGPNGNSSNP